MSYRVRRDLPDNTYVQLKAATLAECKRVMRSLYDKWNDVRDLGFGDPFDVNLGRDELIVTRNGERVDYYVIEEVG